MFLKKYNSRSIYLLSGLVNKNEDKKKIKQIRRKESRGKLETKKVMQKRQKREKQRHMSLTQKTHVQYLLQHC